MYRGLVLAVAAQGFESRLGALRCLSLLLSLVKMLADTGRTFCLIKFDPIIMISILTKDEPIVLISTCSLGRSDFPQVVMKAFPHRVAVCALLPHKPKA